MFASLHAEAPLIQHLRNASAYPHPTRNIEVMETHISWVILTGEFAYKIKKPVNFGFVDYSTLEKRRRFCELEIQLNRRFAADLYLGTVAIVSGDGGLIVSDRSSAGDESEPVEFAVKMRQFSQDDIVAACLRDVRLTPKAIDSFGRYVSRFHDSADVAPVATHFAEFEQVAKDAMDNFAEVRRFLYEGSRFSLLRRLERWTRKQLKILEPKIANRKTRGKVRRCHGDMHLKNIVLMGDQLQAFDGIEFNEELQWIDVLSELAFPVMDFVSRGRPDLGWRLLNSWLEITGDYRNLDLFRFYLVYRAMVRAKVTCLNPKNWSQDTENSAETADDMDRRYVGPWDKYLETAAYLAFDLRPRLAITHGFSGSGKSTAAMKIIEEDGGIRIRSDVERHRLADQCGSHDKYSAEMNDRVYAVLLELAESVAGAGFPVIADATFLTLNRRKPFMQVSQQAGWSFEIVDCDAPFEELCERIIHRGPDASEATVDVLKKQLAKHDPLTAEELTFCRSQS